MKIEIVCFIFIVLSSTFVETVTADTAIGSIHGFTSFEREKNHKNDKNEENI